MGWINGGNCGLCDVKHICCDVEFEEEDDDKTDDDDEAGNSKCENGVLEMGHVFGAVSDGSGGIFRSGSVNPAKELIFLLIEVPNFIYGSSLHYLEFCEKMVGSKFLKSPRALCVS